MPRPLVIPEPFGGRLVAGWPPWTWSTRGRRGLVARDGEIGEATVGRIAAAGVEGDSVRWP